MTLQLLFIVKNVLNISQKMVYHNCNYRHAVAYVGGKIFKIYCATNEAH